MYAHSRCRPTRRPETTSRSLRSCTFGNSCFFGWDCGCSRKCSIACSLQYSMECLQRMFHAMVPGIFHGMSHGTFHGMHNECSRECRIECSMECSIELSSRQWIKTSRAPQPSNLGTFDPLLHRSFHRTFNRPVESSNLNKNFLPGRPTSYTHTHTRSRAHERTQEMPDLAKLLSQRLQRTWALHRKDRVHLRPRFGTNFDRDAFFVVYGRVLVYVSVT